MVNTRQIKVKINTLNQQLSNLNNLINNLSLNLSDINNQETFFTLNILPKYKNEGDKYFDPYNGDDVTKQINDNLNKFTSDKQKIVDQKNQAEGKKILIEREIRGAQIDLIRADADNANERKENFKNKVNKAKKMPRKILEGTNNLFKNLTQFTRRSFNQYKLDRSNNVSFLNRMFDRLFNKGQTLKHSRDFAQKGSHLLTEQSALPPKDFVNSQGNKTASYEHYDSFSHSVDVNLSKEYKQAKTGPNGLEIQEFKSVTVKLNNNNEIDLSLPENQSILQNKKILGELLCQHPNVMKTIPLAVLEKDPKFFASQFTNGVNNMVAKGEFGVDNQGKMQDESAYLEQMTKLGKSRKQELERITQAREDFTEMGNTF